MELRSVIEVLRREVIPELPDARIEEDVVELHRSIEQLELERLRRLGELARRGVHELDGFVSATAWVKHRCGVSGGEAARALRTARALEQMPGTREALEAGEVTASSARVLVEAHQTAPEAFEGAEDVLVEAARRHSVSDLHRVVSSWRERAQRDRFDPRDGRVPPPWGTSSCCAAGTTGPCTRVGSRSRWTVPRPCSVVRTARGSRIGRRLKGRWHAGR